MSSDIHHIANTASSNEICQLLERDGAFIVDNILSPQQLTNLNLELGVDILKTKPGLRNPIAEQTIEFYGSTTIRLDGLPAKSQTFFEVL
jgi:hypothetical protein